ncbi:PREDICTED: zinc finger protein 410-like [Thamnophis sirtalis]|uniref:Zinc finger protein 410-like n=1 Tax=Thamnophis sirtalis TaxID=35019 RepID=A0A6I9XE93_9SAUR|nr:PREDICTED: zinc finger protein 410-like [Thamnophis sirtalis]
MGSSLLEESELDSKSLVSMNSPSSLVESLHLPDPESIIGVKEEVLAEAAVNSLHDVSDVVLPSHHLMPMSTSRHSYGGQLVVLFHREFLPSHALCGYVH